MPYNPGITDRSGEIRAQGMLQGGMGLLGGFEAGMEELKRRKEEDKKNQAAIKANEAALSAILPIAGQISPEMAKAVQEGMLRLSDTNSTTQQRAAVGASMTKTIGELLNTGIEFKKNEQTIKTQVLQGQVAQQQADQLKQENDFLKARNTAWNKSLEEISGLGGGLDNKTVMEVASKNRMAPQDLEMLLKMTKPEEGDATEAKIRRIQQSNPGLTYAQATQLALGQVEVSKNPVTGEDTLVNKAMGTSSPVVSGDQQKKAQAPTKQSGSAPKPGSDGPGLYERAGKATGIIPNALAAMQRVAGLAGQVMGKPGLEVLNAPEVIETQQSLSLAQQRLGRALAENPRFSEGEQQRILKEIDISGGILVDEVTLRSKMRSVNAALKTRIEEAVKDSFNEDLSAEDRRQARRAATDMTNFLDALGIPDDEKKSSTPKATDGELKIDGYRVKVKSTSK